MSGQKTAISRGQRQPAGSHVVGEPVGGFPIAFWIGRALQDKSAGRTNLVLYLRGAARSTMVGHVSSATPFEIRESAQGSTGEALRLVSLGTALPTECGFLFLARSDVRINRKGAWRLPPAVAAGLSGTIGAILHDGRTGEARVVERADGADEGHAHQRP